MEPSKFHFQWFNFAGNARFFSNEPQSPQRKILSNFIVEENKTRQHHNLSKIHDTDAKTLYNSLTFALFAPFVVRSLIPATTFTKFGF
ncbi:hypothetical protein GNF10_17135 [Nostoc sp. UCD121]|uniref:hypothetical protein n=1 Tax=Nostoc sp. UCD121 TaxID=2681305 RepID=UPI00162A6206|nr:hypothetical protein [Nostoc sp. UCD121]MBC1277633.1 hypothetical protein [Nostoc sp. UCD121]MBC1296400.1 hypothetical protein [Nostoc sp. UCD122]